MLRQPLFDLSKHIVLSDTHRDRGEQGSAGPTNFKVRLAGAGADDGLAGMMAVLGVLIVTIVDTGADRRGTSRYPTTEAIDSDIQGWFFTIACQSVSEWRF